VKTVKYFKGLMDIHNKLVEEDSKELDEYMKTT